MMNKKEKIWVAGHRGMVGSAILRKLKNEGYENIIYRSSKELDLRNYNEVVRFIDQEKPDYIFLAAAKVGGILANMTKKAEFLYDNMSIQNNVIHAAYLNNVKKLLFLGSSCIYPKNAQIPISEGALLTGPLEETNDAYAIAKITGIKMCQSYNEQYGTNFISAMPTNLYGPNDNYDLKSSHVLPALIRKFHEAKMNDSASVILWGTGKPMREFLHVDDLADASLFLMNNYSENEIVNVGTGIDLSILDLAQMIKEVVGFSGKIEHDLSKPDGTMRKVMDVEKLNKLGWKYRIELSDGLQSVYKNFVNN